MAANRSRWKRPANTWRASGSGRVSACWWRPSQVKIVGTYALLIMEKLGKRGTPAGVVEDVAVSPSRQGQGIGRAMMEHAREECRRAGCYKLALSSNLRREDAHRFYDSLGFERHGFSFVTHF